MYIAYTGARSAEKRIEQIANNLANASTPGYRRDRSIDAGVAPASFLSDLALVTAGGESPDESLLYAVPSTTQIDFRPGTMRVTGNPMDLAIDGDGFFVVRTGDGDRLTRAGNFRVDADGDLATAGGDKVLGTAGPIHVGNGAFSVGSDGQVSVDGIPVDTLRIRTVADPETLTKVGGTLLAAPSASALVPAGSGVQVHQGMVEDSNVTPVAEMTDMIEASRLFEAYTKMMAAISETTSKATDELARV